jgi:hypothetical protein
VDRGCVHGQGARGDQNRQKNRQSRFGSG